MIFVFIQMSKQCKKQCYCKWNNSNSTLRIWSAVLINCIPYNFPMKLQQESNIDCLTMVQIQFRHHVTENDVAMQWTSFLWFLHILRLRFINLYQLRNMKIANINNKNVDIKMLCTQRVTWITFIGYAQNGKIEKPNNPKIFRRMTNHSEYSLFWIIDRIDQTCNFSMTVTSNNFGKTVCCYSIKSRKPFRTNFLSFTSLLWYSWYVTTTDSIGLFYRMLYMLHVNL